MMYVLQKWKNYDDAKFECTKLKKNLVSLASREKNMCFQRILAEDHRPKDCPYRTQPEHFKCNNKQVKLSEPNLFETNHRADDQCECPSRAHATINHEARLARD
jgi:hypothetical protein